MPLVDPYKFDILEGGSHDLPSDTTQYVDLSDYSDIRIVIKRASQYSPVSRKNTALTSARLSDNNTFFITLQGGYYSNSNNFVVEHEEDLTFDQWVECSTGLQYNSTNDEWVSGGDKENGFGISFSSGDANGTSQDGVLKIIFSATAKVLDGYKKATTELQVYVAEDFYTDELGEEFELIPNHLPLTNKTIQIVLSGETINVASSGDYLLVRAEEQGDFDLPSGNPIVMDVLFDRTNDTFHFYIDTIEIFGVIRNVYYNPQNGSIIQNGEVILFNDYLPPIDGESNIEVTYPCYVPGNMEKINKCRIAKLFGNANAKNRLFVSGNPDFPNCDWHTSARNSYLESGNSMEANGDFSYFGDMDYCFYGQTDNEIMGYDNVATDKMVVLKSKSKVEPTNYFRTSSLIQAIDASGNAVKGIDGSTLYSESFPLATGNIGAGAMNNRSTVNLNGDTLYLSSENTICGLDIAGQVGDSQRISYSRSRFIDPELKELDLSDAVLWTDNTNAFLFTSEATYMTHYETFNSESGQYEWFKINVKGVRCAIDIDGVLYFGNESGGLYKLQKDSYRDSESIFIAVGGTLYSEDKITFSSEYGYFLEDGEDLTFKPRVSDPEESLYRKVASVSQYAFVSIDLKINATNNTLRLVALKNNGKTDFNRYNELLEELAYNGYFYANNGLTPYARYKLAVTDGVEDEYKVYDEDGNEVDLTIWSSFDLCRVLDDEYEITDVDLTNSTFKIRENGRVLDIILYDQQDMGVLSFPSVISKHFPVKSYFISAPAVLGGVSYRKTIWAWTLSAFKEPNDLQVCQATNEDNLEDMKALAFADSIPIGLKLSDFSFLGMDFTKSVVPRKYTYYRPISVPFISFGFKSDKDANSILTATSIIYTIPMLGWGNK